MHHLPLNILDVHPNNLPTQLTSFIGRSKEICLIRQLLSHCQKQGDRLRIAQALSGMAWICFMEGDYDLARTQWEESLALCKETGNLFSLADCLAGFAALAAVQSHMAWALRLLGAREALFEKMAAVPVLGKLNLHDLLPPAASAVIGVEACQAALAEGRTMTPEQALAAQGPVVVSEQTAKTEPQPVPRDLKHPAIPHSSAGLTAREAEVLCLVAQGMTNEQVAEQLVISPRTVNTHLTSIFGKISVSTRSAATRYAIDHHLV